MKVLLDTKKVSGGSCKQYIQSIVTDAFVRGKKYKTDMVCDTSGTCSWELSPAVDASELNKKCKLDLNQATTNAMVNGLLTKVDFNTQAQDIMNMLSPNSRA